MAPFNVHESDSKPRLGREGREDVVKGRARRRQDGTGELPRPKRKNSTFGEELQAFLPYGAVLHG
jgi:hypothetical protein